MADLTKRERIVVELMRRLRAAFPKMPVERGFFRPQVDVFPSIYVMEEEGTKSRHPQKRRGLYVVEFSISVSQWYAGIPLKDSFSKGNAYLAQLTEVIEYDELFNEEDDRARPLTVEVAGNPGVESEEELVRVFTDNKMELYMKYKFRYTEEAPWVQHTIGR